MLFCQKICENSVKKKPPNVEFEDWCIDKSRHGSITFSKKTPLNSLNFDSNNENLSKVYCKKG